MKFFSFFVHFNKMSFKCRQFYVTVGCYCYFIIVRVRAVNIITGIRKIREKWYDKYSKNTHKYEIVVCLTLWEGGHWNRISNWYSHCVGLARMWYGRKSHFCVKAFGWIEISKCVLYRTYLYCISLYHNKRKKEWCINHKLTTQIRYKIARLNAREKKSKCDAVLLSASNKKNRNHFHTLQSTQSK